MAGATGTPRRSTSTPVSPMLVTPTPTMRSDSGACSTAKAGLESTGTQITGVDRGAVRAAPPNGGRLTRRDLASGIVLGDRLTRRRPDVEANPTVHRQSSHRPRQGLDTIPSHSRVCQRSTQGDYVEMETDA
jgi:hypothetical protein